jgi:hypothetical protein
MDPSFKCNRCLDQPKSRYPTLEHLSSDEVLTKNISDIRSRRVQEPITAANMARTADIELASIKRHIQEMRDHLDLLEGLAGRYENSLSVHKYSNSVLCHFPNELLECIMLNALDIPEAEDEMIGLNPYIESPGYIVTHTRRGPWVLAQVCHVWRLVALACPRLWSCMHLNMPPSSEYRDDELGKECLQTYFHRSGSYPLHVLLSQPASFVDCAHKEYHDLIFSTSSRWRSLSIALGRMRAQSINLMVQNLSTLQGKISNLQYLHMALESAECAEVNFKFLHGASSLRCVTLFTHCDAIGGVVLQSFPWSMIQELALLSYGLDITDVLQRCTHLTTLVLEGQILAHTSGSLPCLKRLDISMLYPDYAATTLTHLAPIISSTLQSISICLSPLEDTTNSLSSAFQHFHGRILKLTCHFRIAWGRYRNLAIDTFESLLKSNPQIRHLCFVVGHNPLAFLSSICRRFLDFGSSGLLPGLQHLEFEVLSHDLLVDKAAPTLASDYLNVLESRRGALVGDGTLNGLSSQLCSFTWRSNVALPFTDEGKQRIQVLKSDGLVFRMEFISEADWNNRRSIAYRD